MKKIIKNRVYDTDTAKEIGTWSNGLGPRDFRHVVETLYRKRTGEFFLYGVGGPASKYAKSVGQNEWSGGENITLIEPDAAREWAEKKLTAEEYEAVWTPDEDGKEVLCLSVSAVAAAKLREIAAKSKQPLGATLEEILKNI